MLIESVDFSGLNLIVSVCYLFFDRILYRNERQKVAVEVAEAVMNQAIRFRSTKIRMDEMDYTKYTLYKSGEFIHYLIKYLKDGNGFTEDR